MPILKNNKDPNTLIFHFKKLEKDKKTKPKASRRQETNKNSCFRAETTEIQIRKTMEKRQCNQKLALWKDLKLANI